MVGQLHGMWRRWWLLAVMVLIVALLAVWTAGQMAGLLIRGSWPHVSLAGSVVELMSDGVHGLFGTTVDELAEAVRNVSTLDRIECRRWALEHFSVERMVDDYEFVYEDVTVGQVELEAVGS